MLTLPVRRAPNCSDSRFYWGRLLALLTVLATFLSSSAVHAQTTARDSIPSQAYFNAIEQFYRGNYRNAERTLRREARTSIRFNATTRWIDGIAYHAALGEVYYYQGRLAEALEQFDEACRRYLQYSNWLISVRFLREPQADLNRGRQALPWGKSTRQFTLGRIPDRESYQVGSQQATLQTLRRGGASPLPQQWRIDVTEIVRATSIAIQRRSELLGPLAAHDSLTNDMIAALSRGITTPNHWSRAWASLQLGIAQAGIGRAAEAERNLLRAERLRGNFDHPLTGMVLLELGKLKMQAGDLPAAANLFAEASFSGFYYDDLRVIDEAFRFWSMASLGSGASGVNPALEPAAAWAGRRRYDHIFSRINMALGENLLQVGNLKAAQAALGTGQSRLEDAANGRLGNRAQYLAARLQLMQGRENATSNLGQALSRHISLSVHNFQLLLANQRYDQQQLRARSAVEIYQALLSDPAPEDWVLRPFDTLTALQTPHAAAFERWLNAVLTRKNMAVALEVSDLAKRNRFHSSLAWGGRLAALRDAFEAPPHLLNKNAQNQRSELLLRFPQYGEALKEGQRLQLDLSKGWQPGIDEEDQRDLVKLWRAWERNLDQREAMLSRIGLQRVAADMQFPPILATTDLQKQLQPGQAIAVFHETSSAMRGFLLTSTASTSWRCPPRRRLDGLIKTFLRDLGNYDGNHEVPVADLKADEWQASGEKLYEALFQGSSLDAESLEELIIVPDGALWYVPFAALPVQTEGDELLPLIAAARVRMAPTVGLAVGRTEPWRRTQRTGLVGMEVLPGESDEEKAEALAVLRKAVENAVSFPDPTPAASPVVGALAESLVVLDEVEISPVEPFAWTPLPAGRSNKGRGSLSEWLTLPQTGPQRIVLPAARTVAERGGGKTSKRGKSGQGRPGDELFLSTCGLMSTGAQTILLSTWRVGGDATLQTTREFLQELPYTTAAAAWQRSVQLTKELSLNPEQQPRVKASKKERDEDLLAKHPFFWAGYLLIDTGALAEGQEAVPVARAKR